MRLSILRLAALCLLFLLLLGGCGFKDIDKRFFAVSMGIDSTGEGASAGYEVTLRLAVPSPKIEPGQAKSEVISIKAKTIAEAVRLLKSHVDKELDFGHCKVFVIGEELMESGYEDIMHWLARRRDVQAVSYIAVGKPDARTIVSVDPPTERYPGNTLFLSFGPDGTESSYSYSEYLFDFMRRIGERGLDPVLPIIRQEKDKGEYAITRLALLNKSRMVEYLRPDETQLFNQISTSFKKSSIRAKIDGTYMVIAVNDIASHYRIVRNDDGTHILKLTMRVGGIFEEAPVGIYDQDWSKLEQKFAKQMEEAAVKLFRKVQKAGVDPFGFGLRYRATHKGNEQTWKNWQTIYPKLDFNVKVHVDIEGTGLIR